MLASCGFPCFLMFLLMLLGILAICERAREKVHIVINATWYARSAGYERAREKVDIILMLHGMLGVLVMREPEKKLTWLLMVF